MFRYVRLWLAILLDWRDERRLRYIDCKGQSHPHTAEGLRQLAQADGWTVERLADAEGHRVTMTRRYDIEQWFLPPPRAPSPP